MFFIPIIIVLETEGIADNLLLVLYRFAISTDFLLKGTLDEVKVTLHLEEKYGRSATEHFKQLVLINAEENVALIA